MIERSCQNKPSLVLSHTNNLGIPKHPDHKSRRPCFLVVFFFYLAQSFARKLILSMTNLFSMTVSRETSIRISATLFSERGRLCVLIRKQRLSLQQKHFLLTQQGRASVFLTCFIVDSSVGKIRGRPVAILDRLTETSDDKQRVGGGHPGVKSKATLLWAA